MNSSLDGDGLVKLYDDTVAALLDEQVPLRTKKCRRRLSNLWFDDECRTAKRSLRSLECTHVIPRLCRTPCIRPYRLNADAISVS